MPARTLHFKNEAAHSKYEAFRHIHGKRTGKAPKGQRHVIDSTGRVHRIRSRITVSKSASRYVR